MKPKEFKKSPWQIIYKQVAGTCQSQIALQTLILAKDSNVIFELFTMRKSKQQKTIEKKY